MVLKTFVNPFPHNSSSFMCVNKHFVNKWNTLFSKNDFFFGEICAKWASKLCFVEGTWDPNTNLLVIGQPKFTWRWYQYYINLGVPLFWVCYSIWRLLTKFQNSSPLMQIMLIVVMTAYSSGLVGKFALSFCQREIQTIFNELLLRCRRRKLLIYYLCHILLNHIYN